MAGQAVMDLGFQVVDDAVKFCIIVADQWCHLSIFIQTSRLKYHLSQIASA